jgi:hypothetical protein
MDQDYRKEAGAAAALAGNATEKAILWGMVVTALVVILASFRGVPTFG